MKDGDGSRRVETGSDHHDGDIAALYYGRKILCATSLSYQQKNKEATSLHFARVVTGVGLQLVT